MNSCYFLALLLFLLSSSCVAQAPGPVLTDEIDGFINQVLSEWDSPGGVSVAVVRGDGHGNWSVETKGYGIATANGSQVTENTLFPIGSNSKLFDIIAAGLVVNNATLSPRLSWDSKMASVIKGWSLEDPIAKNQASIIDLMSHRTGMPRHDFSFKLSDDVPSMIKKINFQRPSTEFRETFQYSNMMYTVISDLPTALLGIPFARYVKQYIFDPLGLTSTTYSYDVAKTGDLADGFARQGINYTTGSNPFVGVPRALPFWFPSNEDGNFLSGPAGVVSNAIDMATWLQMLLLNGLKPGTTTRIVDADILQRVSSGISVITPVAEAPELSPVVYGGGQGRGTYRGHEFLEHDGAVPGFNSFVIRFPNDQLGVAVLGNDDDWGSLIVRIILYRVIDAAFGLDAVNWDARLKAIALTSPPLAAPRPTNATLPSIGFSSFTGNYENKGYGTFELCYVSGSNATIINSQSKSCQALASNVSTILPGAVIPESAGGVPAFVTKWDGAFGTSHVLLRHFSGNIFNVSALGSYPTNSNSSAPQFWTKGLDVSIFNSGAVAESVVVGHRQTGFALTGIWGAASGVPAPQGSTPQERAEVWFDKVN